ncbi:threonine aspartase 1-like [Acropora palmata]
MDTVGAVCMDRHGPLCAGFSSGGVIYKTPGRIGQVLLFFDQWSITELGGVLLLRVEEGETDNDCTVDLVWGHTTVSMCVGYITEQDKRPKVLTLSLPRGSPLTSKIVWL